MYTPLRRPDTLNIEGVQKNKRVLIGFQYTAVRLLDDIEPAQLYFNHSNCKNGPGIIAVDQRTRTVK